METAVVENGRIIVKKPVQQAYGVEVQEIGVTGKFQLRLVSGIPDSERSAREDIEEEEKWCEDLAKIRDLLKEAEIELEIEKALEPGSATVKYSETISNSLSQSRHRQSNLKTKKIER